MADPRPPTPRSLISEITGTPDPEPADFRDRGLLADDAPLVPPSLIGGVRRNEYEVVAAFDEAANYYDPQVSLASSVSEDPAPISISPTSSIYPRRPRTVAAGYDRDRDVLTVIFRDGTWWNYYGVGYDTWKAFKAVRSKGRFIAAYLDGHRYGAARVSTSAVDVKHREALYRVARTAQVVQGGVQRQRGAKQSFKPRYGSRRAKRY